MAASRGQHIFPWVYHVHYLPLQVVIAIATHLATLARSVQYQVVLRHDGNVGNIYTLIVCPNQLTLSAKAPKEVYYKHTNTYTHTKITRFS